MAEFLLVSPTYRVCEIRGVVVKQGEGKRDRVDNKDLWSENKKD
jgi:hypothetical protein